MRYESSGTRDQGCLIGSGDPDDSVNEPCRNIPSNQLETFPADFGLDFEQEFGQEFECKFPFFFNGKKYNECILFIEDEFLYPVFRCPIRDIVTKINGTNSFVSYPIVGGGLGYCLSDPSSESSPLDPDWEGCTFLHRRLPFSQCKNNCPGGRKIIKSKFKEISTASNT